MKTYAHFISRWILLRMRNVSDKSCRENKNTHFVFKNFFFSRKSCRLWDSVEKHGRGRQATHDSIIRPSRFACWITKTRDKHSEYVILVAFPRQQWLRERVSVLRYTYIALLIYCYSSWCVCVCACARFCCRYH